MYLVVKMAERNGSDRASCFEFSERQLKQVIVADISVSAVALTACTIAVILIIVFKQYRTFLHRLMLYLMVAACGTTISFALEPVPVHHNGKYIEVKKGLEDVCAAIGFFAQIMEWIFHGIIFWIVVYLTLLAVFKYRANKRQHEVTGLIIILLFPFTFNWVPFVNNMYGLSGLWCWIKLTNGDCHNYTQGIIYQFTLYYGPVAILVFFSSIAFIAIVIVLCKEKATTRSSGTAHYQALKEALPMLVYPVIFNVLFTVMLANRIHYAIAVSKREKTSFPLFLAQAIVESMRMLLAALGFLLHPNILKKIFCRESSLDTDSATAYIVSPENSGSEEDYLVIRGTDHEGSISDYHSIFEGSIR